MLLSRALRAAVACGEYALETTVRLLSAVILDDRTRAQTATNGAVEPPHGEAVGVPIRRSTPAEVSEAVRFGLDGEAYEIDLRPEDASQLRAAFRPYIAAGRPADGRPAPAINNGTPRPGGTDRGQDTATIRDWARAHGHQVADRGRIPTRVLQAYQAARQ